MEAANRLWYLIVCSYEVELVLKSTQGQRTRHIMVEYVYLAFWHWLCVVTVLAAVPCFASGEGASAETAIVEGIVTDPNGSPIRGAEVSAIQVISRPNTRKRQVVQTGEDGKFRFCVLAEPKVLVSCTAPAGWRTRVSRRWIAPNGEVLRYIVRKDTGNESDFAPVEREVVIRGRVADIAGRGVANASIVGRTDLKGASCKSGEDGTFELRHIVVARWEPSFLSMNLYVDVPELRMGNTGRVTFNERWEYYADLQVLPYRKAEGTVTNEAGEAIGGISILRRNHSLSLKWVHVTKTDERGQYKVDDLVPGVYYSFCALSDGYGTRRSGLVYPTGKESSEVVIKVSPRNESVEGIAQRDDGTPVAGALVSVEPCLGEHYEVATDTGGRFRFKGLIGGEVELRGRKRDGRIPGGWLHGSVKCLAGDKSVTLELIPVGCSW